MTMKAETGDRWSICREHQQGYTGWFFALHCESNSQESRIKGQAGLRQQTQGSYLNLSVSSESEKCRKSHCTQRWSIEVIEINFERCSDGCAPNRPSYSSSQPKSHEANGIVFSRPRTSADSVLLPGEHNRRELSRSVGDRKAMCTGLPYGWRHRHCPVGAQPNHADSRPMRQTQREPGGVSGRSPHGSSSLPVHGEGEE
mmetsp:Transcript_36052/g.89917  ORF Transcript_36052/g.89917 Transcript_36052/m.89917 type:complete len:200 (+) Transcript_36052:1369-1968(+)